jgi:putative phosphoesterase
VRLAVLSDVHGNLPALEAVLAELDFAALDGVVVCGDVASGPLPAETIDLLMSLDGARFVRGNADRGLVAAYDHVPLPRWPGPAAEWCAARISGRHRDFLSSFAEAIRLDVDGLGRVLFCHGSPRSDEEIISVRTPLLRLRPMVGGVNADVVVCGHTHMPFDRRVDGVRVVNPGSVGMPYEAPGAYWALIGPDVEFRRTDYDRAAAAARIRAATGADTDTFVRENLLTVPSADEAFAFFAAHSGP